MSNAVLEMPDPSSTPTSIAEIIIGAGAVASALVVGANKLIAMWGATKVESSHAAAQAEIVNGLRDELARLRAQNCEFATTMDNLRQEITHLRLENLQLQETIESLRGEVLRLRESNDESINGQLTP